MEFKISVSTDKSAVSRVGLEVIAYCNELKDGELVSTRALSEALGRPYKSLKGCGAESALKTYFHKIKSPMGGFTAGTNLWGNTKTVKAFKQQMTK